jgi:hypothetical protein
MNLETIGLIVGIWSAAGFGFFALWAVAHRQRDQFVVARRRVERPPVRQR